MREPSALIGNSIPRLGRCCITGGMAASAGKEWRRKQFLDLFVSLSIQINHIERAMFTTKEIYPSSTFSFGEVSRQRRILPMTIAIGAICADANAVVLIADRTVCSVSDGTTLCCESPGGKLHKWSESIEVVYAGVAEYGGMILHEAQKNSGGMTTVEGVAEAISNEREKLRKRKLKLFRKRLLQRDLLILDSTSEQLKSQSYKELLKGNGWDISFLIAGVDKNVPHLWTIDEDNGLLCRDDRGFVAFGSGEGPAVFVVVQASRLKAYGLVYSYVQSL
jgi:hypothetical protein